jgi:hypothetical protein
MDRSPLESPLSQAKHPKQPVRLLSYSVALFNIANGFDPIGSELDERGRVVFLFAPEAREAGVQHCYRAAKARLDALTAAVQR